MQRHVADPYVQRAKALGYRSRAAFKLLEIDARDRLFAAGQIVVDLGAAPGGWSQVAAEKTGARGRVVAIDVLDMARLPGVTFVRGDFTAEAVLRELERVLNWLKTVIRTSPMTSQMTRFLTRLFNAAPRQLRSRRARGSW